MVRVVPVLEVSILIHVDNKIYCSGVCIYYDFWSCFENYGSSHCYWCCYCKLAVLTATGATTANWRFSLLLVLLLQTDVSVFSIELSCSYAIT